MDVVEGHFRPEFLNRIDEAVVFHPLGQEQIRAITEIQIDYLRRRWPSVILRCRSAPQPGSFG